jgi:CDP-glycerol glycerophosphotransferase (TagB/SpsB family)
VVFLPHPNLLQYLDFFEVPTGVEVKTFGDGESIQDLFRSLSLFVTDYSSKAFDVAYLDKPLIYYQFDPDVYFGGGHTGRRGYFDFERDGFGPVCRTEEAFLDAIEIALKPGGPVASTYRERAAATFAFRDGKCSERVFETILTLDRPVAGSSRA